MNARPAPLSEVEIIKRESRRLRGTLRESLADPVTGAIAESDTQLIKFHGSYQQDDRDRRDERRLRKLEPDYQFMIRTRLPGGVVMPRQWLALDAIATRYASSGLRLTTRQAFQLHGVIKRDLKATMQAINADMIDTLAACGDVNRNVLVAAGPASARVHAAVLDVARDLSGLLLPKTRAYYEIWLDEKRQAGSGEEDEPLYGPTYLPRKFKVAFAVPPVNDVDVFAHDLGFTAIVEDGRLAGFNVSVGGGLGVTHGDSLTYPRLADTLGFITPGQVNAVAAAVVTTQRDFGDRGNRKRARLKYTIDERGVEWFKREVEHRSGTAFDAPREVRFTGHGDSFGWQHSDDGVSHLTLRIQSGRVVDTPDAPHRTGLREIARVHVGEFRLTPNQNLVISNVPAHERERIDGMVARHALDGYRQSTPARLHALACVALPTCSQAMAEAERYLPTLLERFESMLDRHGLHDTPIYLRISGCPNGCSRPYLGEVALVGKGPGRYNLMLGADARGQRLNRLYRENLDEPEIFAALDPLLARYARQRNDSERFGDFLLRVGEIDSPDAGRSPLHVEVIS